MIIDSRLAGSLGPSPCERLKQHTMRTTIVAVLCRCPSSQLLNEPSFLLLYYTIGIAILTPLNFDFLAGCYTGYCHRIRAVESSRMI